MTVAKKLEILIGAAYLLKENSTLEERIDI